MSSAEFMSTHEGKLQDCNKELHTYPIGYLGHLSSLPIAHAGPHIQVHSLQILHNIWLWVSDTVTVPFLVGRVARWNLVEALASKSPWTWVLERDMYRNVLLFYLSSCGFVTFSPSAPIPWTSPGSVFMLSAQAVISGTFPPQFIQAQCLACGQPQQEASWTYKTLLVHTTPQFLSRKIKRKEGMIWQKPPCQVLLVILETRAEGLAPFSAPNPLPAANRDNEIRGGC